MNRPLGLLFVKGALTPHIATARYISMGLLFFFSHESMYVATEDNAVSCWAEDKLAESRVAKNSILFMR